MNVKKVSTKVWIILTAVLASQILFDLLSGIVNISENIRAYAGWLFARQRWGVQNITNYSFETWTGFNGVCITSARVEVLNGKNAGVFCKDNLLAMKVSNIPLPPEKWGKSELRGLFISTTMPIHDAPNLR